MNKILIIGSEGFIGQHLKFTLSLKYIIYTCDLQDSSSPRFPHHRFTRPEDLGFLICQNKFYAIINCAGAANVSQSIQNPLRDYSLNTSFVAQILDAIRISAQPTKLLNISSAAVYGNPISLPIPESAQVLPISPYGYHKLMSEIICEEYFQLFGIPTCSIRIFSAYGPGLRKQILWDTYEKMRKQPEGIIMFGSGEESRDFVYIDDIVDQIELILNKAAFTGDIINVANGEQVLIREVVDHIKQCINYKGEITFNGKQRAGDPLNWEADISLIKGLGYQRKYSFRQGVEKFVIWAEKLNK